MTAPHRTIRSLLAITLLSAAASTGPGLLWGALGASPASAAAAAAAAKPFGTAATVCANITNCRLVTSKDVDGDGDADQVGWHQVSDDAVQIRVQTAAGHLLTSRVDVRFWWGGGAWAGAAPVDDAAGVELLVGSMQGAHTPMYTMLTYRSGKLVVEDSPSPLSKLWQVDAADGDYMGWWRHTLHDGRIAMTQKIAVRIGVGPRFRCDNVTYAWSDGAWVATSSSTRTYPTGKAASVIAGFHVSGLKAFPGVQ